MILRRIGNYFNKKWSSFLNFVEEVFMPGENVENPIGETNAGGGAIGFGVTCLIFGSVLTPFPPSMPVGVTLLILGGALTGGGGIVEFIKYKVNKRKEERKEHALKNPHHYFKNDPDEIVPKKDEKRNIIIQERTSNNNSSEELIVRDDMAPIRRRQ